MKKLLAVDVAFLPRITVMDELIGLIRYDSTSPIILNKVNCLPHITLAMGVIHEGDRAAISDVLAGFSSDAMSIELIAESTNTYLADNGKRLSEVTLKLTKELLDYRTRVATAVRPMFTDVLPTTDMFFSPPEVEPVTTQWVLKFGEAFRPHVTLGVGQVEELAQPITFYPEKLALCQLGNYCTCRRVLI